MVGGSKSAKGGPYPLADLDGGRGPNPLADMDRRVQIRGGSKSAMTLASNKNPVVTIKRDFLKDKTVFSVINFLIFFFHL